MELKDWVKAARLHAGLTIEQLGIALGRSKGAAGFWERGNTKPSYAQVKQIAQITGYPMPDTEQESLADHVAEPRAISRGGHGVPVVGAAQLGDNGYFCELEYPVGHGDGRVDWPARGTSMYALRCQGESMKPRIRHGEFVVIDPAHAYVPGDEVLVKSTEGKVMIKQLAYIRDGMVHLDSINESHSRISIPQEQIEVIQYMAGIAKSALWSPD